MLCASWDETGPLTLIEAMALGKPILSTKVGVVGRTSLRKRMRCLWNRATPVGLAAAIQRLVQRS